MVHKYYGSCLCSAISFNVTGFSESAANCHCTMCRKFHGAAYGTLVSVTGLTWLKGFELMKHFTAKNGTQRSFCQECGSSLGFRVKNASINEIEIAISTFDEDIPIKIDAQIYTEDKANWSELQQGIPSFLQGRNES